MNYKNIRFKNTMKDFKRWDREFPPLERGQHLTFYKQGNYYLALQKVTGFLSADPFLGITLRVYDEQEQDFNLLDAGEKERILKEHFKEEIKEYKKRYNL